ncbi:MAG TPA: hypothetical protein VM165_04125 [Planctomycetaceae bacterium]|nr:hypothetical protein [Planctomycetaceae bacterium]
MQLGRAVRGVLPQRPSHLGQCPEQAPVHGDQIGQRRPMRRRRRPRTGERPLGQLGDDRLQERGVEHAGGLAQRPQRGLRHPAQLLNLVQRGDLPEAAEAVHNRVEIVQQHQLGVLIEEQLPILGGIPQRAGRMQRIEQLGDESEILESLQLPSLDRPPLLPTGHGIPP